MRKPCIVFNIRNCAEDYVAVSRFYDLLYKSEEKVNLTTELCGKVFVFWAEEDIRKEKVFSVVAQKLQDGSLKQYEEAELDKNMRFDAYIRVEHEPDDATIEYIYLITLLYKFPECACLLYVDGQANDKYAVWNKAVDFFMDFSERRCIYEGRIYGEYYSQKDKLWQIERIKNKKNSGTHSKINPVIELDDSQKEILFWRSSIRRHESDNGLNKEKYKQVILRCKKNFIEEYKKKSVKREQYYTDMYENEVFQKNVKDMPLLAFYLFCMQMFYSKKGKCLGANDVKKIRLNAWDIAEGILQLVENIYHTTRKVGFLDIRVHEAALEKKYLSERYGVPNGARGFFYEIRLLDISEESIIENFQKKMGCDSRTDFLTISDFFQKNHNPEVEKFWRIYNCEEENLVHHYGLQVFASIVSANEGVFKVISSSKYQFEQDETYTNINTGDHGSAGQAHMPGTEYLILLPLKAENHRIVTSVEDDTEYQYDMETEYKVEQYHIQENGIMSVEYYDYGNQETKEQLINCLAHQMYEWLHDCSQKIDKEKKFVSLFSVKEWNDFSLEIFCKSVILCGIIYQKRDHKDFYCILNDCEENQILEIVRLFAVFYCKAALTCFLEKTQIYLAGENEEFLITGKNIDSLYAITSKIMLVKGINKKTADIMQYLQAQYSVNSNNVDENSRKVKLVPFDMLKIPDSEMTLFEMGVAKTLNSDIQKYSLGCKINHTHMRIGSKLHIGEFFEAELLFHNNYYISRFAALVLKKLSLDVNKKLILVGYETYSELLLYKIVKEISNISRNDGQHYQVSYMIYEQRLGGKFRYMDEECLEYEKDLQFAIVIPINSTLTTHNKVRQSLEEELRARDIQKDKTEIVANYALILIRPSNEMDDEHASLFRGSVQGRKIKTSLIPAGEPDIEYFVCVYTEWYSPLKCPFCFPRNYAEERPLIETDKTSIVPVQLLGMLEPDLMQSPYLEINKNNTERVKALKDSLIYQHVTRNGNHFLYYFRLEYYFIQERNHIIQWLKSERNKIKKEPGRIVYDIIVSPLHYSGAGFLAEVNHYLFNNAALVLNFEVEKEFRQNVKTKYSNIIGLYYNLSQMKKKALIRFHFVDDTIVSGRTFARAKNIFQSLLEPVSDNIQVEVFSDIVILLNRMSADSVINLIGNGREEHFHSYVNLNISSMRNHEDACTECKLVANFSKLRDQSATNQQYRYWNDKIRQHMPIDVQFSDFQNCTSEHKERAYKRMFCSHRINERLNALGNEKNNVDRVRKEMIDLMLEQKHDQMEWIISYIKIFSRPFVIFRKSNREAIFQILLWMMEYVTNDLIGNRKTINTKYKEIRDICIFLREQKEKENNQICNLLLILMKRLSDLGSNYIIRKENMLNILKCADALLESVAERSAFRDRYVGIIKRSCCSSSDEIKSTFLEYLLFFGEEYGQLSPEAESKAICEQKLFLLMEMEGTDFFWRAFFENTRVLIDGISDMAKDLKRKPNRTLNRILQEYYYENFNCILHLYGYWDIKERKITAREESVLKSLVRLYNFLHDGNTYTDNDAEVYYRDFLKIIKAITHVKKCYLLYAAEVDNSGTKHYYQIQENEEIEFWEESDNSIDQQHLVLIADTCALPYEVKIDDIIYKRSMIKYELRNNDENSEKLTDTILLQMDFSGEEPKWQIMIRLKLIMLFHNMILEHLKQDFTNNMIQKWSVREYFNRQMRLQRATDHTDRDNLLKYFNQICFLYQSVDGKPVEKERLERDRALFHMVINSYIARMNVQLLAKANPEREPSRASFRLVYRRQIRPLIESLHMIENFRILGKDGEEGFSQTLLDPKVRLRQTEEGESLSFRRIGVIMAELILSAISHSGEGGRADIYIYREKENLVVLNYFHSRKSLSKIKQDIKYAVNRKKDGISLATIKGTVNACYDLDEQTGVDIDADEDDQKKIFFYVKLPILYVRED